MHLKIQKGKGKIKVEVSTINSSEKLSLKGNQTRLNVNFKPDMIENKIASFLEVAIVDNGIGFKDEEQIRLIWERFYRLPNKNLNSNIGSGIGLALTKELTQIHHGLILLNPIQWEVQHLKFGSQGRVNGSQISKM
jgi:signal transduction histidine kinase